MSSSLIRDDVLPVGVGYLLVMGALGLGLWLLRRHGDAVAGGSRAGDGGRRREADPGRGGEVAAGAGPAGPRPDWGRLIRHYAGTAIGGYLLLMAVVILYYYGVAQVGGAFIESAFTGCALLIALTTPVFALASWLAERYRARSRTRVTGGPHPGSDPGPASAPPAPRVPS